jgi:Terminase large subunit, T4likevirus-type, N-terminal
MPDVRELRSRLDVFAAEVGCALADWQVRALDLATRITAIVAPRQSGKSRSLAMLALWSAFRTPGYRVLIVSAGEEASRRLLAEVRRVATGSELLRGSVTDEQAGLLTLSNGSEIRSVPASERQVRGWTVDLLLVDEAALVPDDLLLGAAIPTTAARQDARIVLASSALSASGGFYDHVALGEAGSEHVRTYRWRLADATWITPSAIAAARESMSELRFRAEYEGEFAGSADALFSRQVLERATADYRPLSLRELSGPARVLGGVDWGQTTDRSALVAIARLPDPERRVFCVATAERWAAGHPLHRVVAEIARSPADFAAIAPETNGLGGPCAQMLDRAMRARPLSRGGGEPPGQAVLVDEAELQQMLREGRSQARVERRPGFYTHRVPVHSTAELKAACYSALRLLIEQERLLLPRSAEELLRELLMLRVDLTPSGTERIEASAGHDDLADALMLATIPTRDQRTGRWRTVLANLAEPRRPLAPAHPVRLAEPEVETGGGLRLYRRPALQSVTGTEISIPPGAELAPDPRPTDPRLERLRESASAALAARKETANG